VNVVDCEAASAAMAGATVRALLVSVTVAVAVGLVPPGPVHTIEKAVVADRAAVLWLPLTARLPLQPPEAAHAVALVAFQASVEVPPLAMAEGLAVKVTAGTD
jgi:hypothetical protein